MFWLYQCKYKKQTPSALGCIHHIWGAKWWVELWGYGWRLLARRWQGTGGTDCHRAAVRLCWPAVCYLLQQWLGSQCDVCKVGQHIIYIPSLSSLLPLSVTISNSSSALSLTLSDICFITYLTSCLCFSFPFSNPSPFSLFCFLKLGSLSSRQPNSSCYHSNPSSCGSPLMVPSTLVCLFPCVAGGKKGIEIAS